MKRLLVLAGVLALEAAFFALVTGQRIDLEYVGDLFARSSHVLVLAFGMTIVISTAGIDLSVGSMAALAAAVMAVTADAGPFWAVAAPAGLLAALAMGVSNGLLVAFFDVPPIVATLGTMILYRGLCSVVLGDVELSPFLDVRGYSVLAEPAGAMAIVLVLYVVGGMVFQRSRWRREALVIGGNRVAARYAGVRVGRRTVEVYGLLGALAFVAAVLYTARNGSVSASALTGLELRVIVAVILGGTSVEGGSASIAGTFLGVLVIGVLDEGLRGAKRWGDEHLPFEIGHVRFVALGVLLAVGVWLNARVDRSSGKEQHG